MIVCDICARPFAFAEMAKISEMQIGSTSCAFTPGGQPQEKTMIRLHVCDRCDKSLWGEIKKGVEGAVFFAKQAKTAPAPAMPKDGEGLLEAIMAN